MFRTFVIGILLGLMLTGGLAYLVPAVKQHREASLISVQANGGNRESFHVNLPQDRIMAAGRGADATLPAGLQWPQAGGLADSRTELFKVRNERGTVVGVASRIAAPAPDNGNIIEWALHLPARGTLYMSLQSEPDASGGRSGALLAGTREFTGLGGRVSERFVPVAGRDEDETGAEGRIELVTARSSAQGGRQ